MPISINGTTGISGVDGSAGTPALQGSDTNTGIAFGSDTILGSTGGTERFRCDSSGRLLVGTSSSRSNVYNTTGYDARFQLEGTDGGTTAIGVFRNSNDNGGSRTIYAKSRGTSIGSNTVVQSGDQLGSVSFQGSDGSEFVEGACIECFVDGTPGANDMPGRLVFSTTADGASSPTERMRITSGGAVYIGVTSEPNGSVGGSGFVPTSMGRNLLRLATTTTAGPTGLADFFNPNGGVGSITVNGSSTSFNTSSDYRLKENIAPVADGIIRLRQLKPSRFNFIADPDTTVDGFIAHEVQAVVPEAIAGEKDAVDDDGNPVYQGIDQSKLVPLLTAALQEAIAKIESLEARLTALEVTP